MRKIALLLALFPAFANAHFVWVYAGITGKTAKIEITDEPGKGPVPMKVVSKPGEPTKLDPMGLKDIKPLPDGKGLEAIMTSPSAAVSLVYGLHGDDMVTWYAKAASNLGAAGASLKQAYEVTVRESGNKLVAKVLHAGQAIPGATLEVYGAGIAKGLVLKSDKNGEASFDKVKSGYLCIGAIVTVPGSGTYKGKAYKQRQEMASITVKM